tara:strand:+ start:468 stop:869 length:402 start_codon:yes stop_codon:yes gene_type:complete
MATHNNNFLGRTMMQLIRDAQLASNPSRGGGYTGKGGKQHNAEKGSAVARRRRIQTELTRKDKTKTVFGDTATGYGNFGKSKNNTLIEKNGIGVIGQAGFRKTNKSANKGTQGDYIYFKNVIPTPGKISTGKD